MGQGNLISKIGDPIILVYQLHDGAETKYIKAHLTSHDGTVLTGSPYLLPHQSNGKYVYFDLNNLVYPAGAEQVHATYVVYDDPACTIASKKHSRGLDIFQIDPSESSSVSLEDLEAKICQIIGILSSTFPSAEITGIIQKDDEILGKITNEEIYGLLASDEIDGSVQIDEILGTIDLNEIVGTVEEY